MLRFPTWKWMPLRSVGNESGAPPARPCLPTVEKLDKRVLLSATLSEGSTPGQVAAGITEDGIKLTEAEYAALSSINVNGLDDKHKGEITVLANEFLNLDNIFMKYGQDILEQKVSPGEIVITKPFDKASAELAKIDQLATDLNILPAVQNIETAALGEGGDGSGGLLGDLTNLLNSGLVDTIPFDDRMVYVKMGDEFMKINETLFDFKVDVLMSAPLDNEVTVALDKTKQEFLEIKFETVVITSVNDQLPSGFLDGLQTEIDGLITGNGTIG